MSLQLQLQNTIRRPVYSNVVSRYLSVDSASAKKHPTGQPPGVGLYWTKKGEDPEVAFMLVHYSGDFSEHYLSGPLAYRGFGGSLLAIATVAVRRWHSQQCKDSTLSSARIALSAVPGSTLRSATIAQERTSGTQPNLYYKEKDVSDRTAQRARNAISLKTARIATESFVLERALDDIAAGTRWLVENTGMKKLVFIGNSGGGSLMAAFQAKAEKDTSIRGADAFIFLNAHPGRADALTDWLDPSVIDENDPTKRDPTLDMYNPANGPPYSKEFQTRYREAQRQRNHRITAWAKAERQRLNDAGVEDRMFSVYRTSADLRFKDPTIDPSNRPPPACLQGPDPEKANRGLGYLARATTLESFLSMWSLEESQSRFKLQAATFSLPTLVIQSTHDVSIFPSMAQSLYNMVGSKDKELKWISGAHYFEDSFESLENVANVIAEWTKRKLSI